MTHHPRRAGVARILAAGAVLLAGATLTASPARAATVDRVSGADPGSTVAAISASAFPPGTPVAIVATDATFPDALAGGAAGVALGAPVLLTSGTSLHPAIEAELRRLAPQTILVLGGPAAVSDAVVAQLQGIAVSVERLAGADRFATAVAVARRAFPAVGGVVYVASGLNFPDALAGGPAAGLAGGPVLLVTKDAIPAVTAAELTRRKPAEIRVLGGPAAVSDATGFKLGAYAPRLGRLAGPDRYATAVEISKASFPNGAPVAYLATGSAFTSALAGAPVAGRAGGPLLLTDPACVPPTVKAELDRLGAARVVVLGGPDEVSVAVEQQAACVAPPPPGLLAPGSFITMGRIETYGFAAHLGADWLDGAGKQICPPGPGCGYWALRNVLNDGSVEGGGVPVEPSGVKMGRIELYPDLQLTKWGTNDNWDPALAVGGLHLWNPDGRALNGLRLPSAANGAQRFVAPVVAGGVPVADGRFRSQVFQLVPKDGTAGAFNIATSRGGQWTTGFVWPGTYELFFFDDATGHSIYVRAALPLPFTLDLAKPCFGFGACTTLS